MKETLTQWLTIAALTVLTPLALLGGLEVRNRMLCGEVCRPLVIEQADVDELKRTVSAIRLQRRQLDDEGEKPKKISK